jgi:hypothetical protein
MVSVRSIPQVAAVYRQTSPASPVAIWHQSREKRPDLVVVLKTVQPLACYIALQHTTIYLITT